MNKPVGNVSVANGLWGENTAISYLQKHGYAIIARNARPCRKDARLEIDAIAYDKSCDTVAFVEVKQHARRSNLQRRIRSVDRRKMNLLRRACVSWLLSSGWKGSYRFDVIEIYGSPGDCSPPAVDHIQRVRLFSRTDRFVNWND